MLDLGVFGRESSSGRLLDLSDEVHVDVVLQLLHRLLLVAAEDAAEAVGSRGIVGAAASVLPNGRRGRAFDLLMKK